MTVFWEHIPSNELLKVFGVCHFRLQDAVPVLYLREGRTLASASLVWYLLLASFITRCGAFALNWSERADKEFLFLCCSHLSILIGKLINICTSGCQLLTVKFCYKAHFINTKDALSTILLNKHLQMRSSFIISYNYRRFWKQFAVCAFGSRFLGSCVLLLGAVRDTTNDNNG